MRGKMVRDVVWRSAAAAAAGAGMLALASGVASAQGLTTAAQSGGSHLLAIPSASCPGPSSGGTPGTGGPPGNGGTPGTPGTPQTGPGFSTSPGSSSNQPPSTSPSLFGYYTTAATSPATGSELAFTGFNAAAGSVIALGLLAGGALIVRLSRLGELDAATDGADT